MMKFLPMVFYISGFTVSWMLVRYDTVYCDMDDSDVYSLDMHYELLGIIIACGSWFMVILLILESSSRYRLREGFINHARIGTFF